MIAYDQGAAGFFDRRSGWACQRTAGLMTTSARLKAEILQSNRPGRQENRGPIPLLSAEWPETLCEIVLRRFHRELEDLNCATAFAGEADLEDGQEFGTLDAADTNEHDEVLPNFTPSPELHRQESLEEEQLGQLPVTEQERKRKWLGISRNQRLAIRRLHHMTGHASNEAMMRMLRSAGSSPAVVSARRHFRCQVCRDQQQPPAPRPVAEPPAYRFNFQVWSAMPLRLWTLPGASTPYCPWWIVAPDFTSQAGWRQEEHQLPEHAPISSIPPGCRGRDLRGFSPRTKGSTTRGS